MRFVKTTLCNKYLTWGLAPTYLELYGLKLTTKYDY